MMRCTYECKGYTGSMTKMIQNMLDKLPLFGRRNIETKATVAMQEQNRGLKVSVQCNWHTAFLPAPGRLHDHIQ